MQSAREYPKRDWRHQVRRGVPDHGWVSPPLKLPHFQEEILGSTAHRVSYRRRGASVEPAFGAIKDLAGEAVQRGSYRVMGLFKTGLLVAFALAGANLLLARAFERRLNRGGTQPSPNRSGRPRDQRMTVYRDYVARAQGKRKTSRDNVLAE